MNFNKKYCSNKIFKLLFIIILASTTLLLGDVTSFSNIILNIKNIGGDFIEK